MAGMRLGPRTSCVAGLSSICGLGAERLGAHHSWGHLHEAGPAAVVVEWERPLNRHSNPSLVFNPQGIWVQGTLQGGEVRSGSPSTPRGDR